MEIFKPLPLLPLPIEKTKPKLGFHFIVNEEDKDEKHIGELIKTNPWLKTYCNLGRKSKESIWQAKNFTVEEKTVYIDIFLTSRNGDQRLMQQINKTSGPPTRIRKWNEFNQFR